MPTKIFEEFLKILKEFKSFIGDHAYKHPFHYALAISILTWFFNPNLISTFLVFLISVIFVSYCFNIVIPSMKKLYENLLKQRKLDNENLLKQRKLNKHLSNISKEQKKILLNFFPHPNAPRYLSYHDTDYALNELIENKLLFLINKYTIFDTECMEVEIKISEDIIELLNKKNLLENWKNEIKSEEKKQA